VAERFGDSGPGLGGGRRELVGAEHLRVGHQDRNASTLTIVPTKMPENCARNCRWARRRHPEEDRRAEPRRIGKSDVRTLKATLGQ